MGLAVPQASLPVADVAQTAHAAGVALGHRGPRQGARAPRLRQRPAPRNQRLVVSAASPCGTWRSRAVTHHGPVGGGGAPACLPPQPGARGHPNRRAARPLARRARAGALPPVSVPQGAAARRALGRARAAVSRALPTAPVWGTYRGVWSKKLRPGGFKHRIQLRITGAAGRVAKRLLQNGWRDSNYLPVLLKFVGQTITCKDVIGPPSKFDLAFLPLKAEVLMLVEAMVTIRSGLRHMPVTELYHVKDSKG